MSAGLFKDLRRIEAPAGALGLVVLLGTASALLEAAGLVLVVALADALSSGEDRFDGGLGPFSLDLGRTQLAGLALACILGSVILLLVANRVRVTSTVKWTAQRRELMIDRFLDADWSVQALERAGRLQTVAGYLAQASLVLVNAATAARGITGVLVLLLTALIVSPIAAVGILALGGLLFLVLRPLNARARARSHQAALQTQELNENIGELAESARDIRVFGVRGPFQRRSHCVVARLAESEAAMGQLSGAVAPVYQGAALTLIVVSLAAAGSAQSVDVAVLGAVALLVLRSVSYGQQFQASYNAVQVALPSFSLFEDAMRQLQHSSPLFGERELGPISNVVLRDVAYSYGDDLVALQGIDVTLHKGEIVGVVGPSGSGKSTLAQLLLRLRAPSAGEVLVNGDPVGCYSPESWSRRVSLVPQSTQLVHGSVLDNITFFREWISPAEAQQAAEAAGISDMISGFSSGMGTLIGKSLRDLSGGQVQRVGIARALAGRPSMIVLDEPTSALDLRSEAWVQTSLSALRGDVLVVIIAHRLSTLSICDRVLVLRDGQVDADGTVEEASEQSEFFREALAHGTLEIGEPGGTSAGSGCQDDRTVVG